MTPTRENVRPDEGASFACLDIDVPEFDHDYHFHPEFELTWIVEGEGERLVGDSIEAFGRDDLVLIGGHVPHRYRNWRRSRARSRVIQFRRDLLADSLLKLPEFGGIDRLLNESSRGLVFSPQTCAAVRSGMRRIFAAEPGPMRLVYLLEALHFLSLDSSRKPLASVVYDQPVNVRTISRMQRILNHLERNWQEAVTLEQVASVAALHPQSVSRFFRQQLGMTFQEYLVRLRLGNAARGLITTERTVADIAYQCGFNNLANFNRHFRTNYGTSPSIYRQRGR